jgi:hypothetical protein
MHAKREGRGMNEIQGITHLMIITVKRAKRESTCKRE